MSQRESRAGEEDRSQDGHKRLHPGKCRTDIGGRGDSCGGSRLEERAQGFRFRPTSFRGHSELTLASSSLTFCGGGRQVSAGERGCPCIRCFGPPDWLGPPTLLFGVGGGQRSAPSSIPTFRRLKEDKTANHPQSDPQTYVTRRS